MGGSLQSAPKTQELSTRSARPPTSTSSSPRSKGTPRPARSRTCSSSTASNTALSNAAPTTTTSSSSCSSPAAPPFLGPSRKPTSSMTTSRSTPGSTPTAARARSTRTRCTTSRRSWTGRMRMCVGSASTISREQRARRRATSFGLRARMLCEHPQAPRATSCSPRPPTALPPLGRAGTSAAQPPTAGSLAPAPLALSRPQARA
mmetsp:Transcript_22458/g.53039  ORF Transcript_22458/g.53039 Transcript_22458/m.53039 type:complete len:204 (+) Transcript_22458:298-909(+)